MTIARVTGVLLGTDEATGITIGAGAEGTASAVDILGNNTSRGTYNLYFKFTSTVAVGAVNVFLHATRALAGLPFIYNPSPLGTFAPIVGTLRFNILPAGRISRFVIPSVINNTAAPLTNVLLTYELFQES